MSSSASTTVGNVVVVTHVHPAPQPGEHQPSAGTKFSIGKPAALGTVQIMIGVVMLLFGIAMLFVGPSLGVISGFFVWGAALFTVSGSLSVAAEKSGNRCLLNGALALNIISIVVAVVGVILYSLDSVIWFSYDNRLVLFQGSSGILAVLTFLELIVSATLTGFACNAVCTCCTREPLVVVRSVDGSMPTRTLPTYQSAATVSAQFNPQAGVHFKNSDPSAAGVPPAYDAPH